MVFGSGYYVLDSYVQAVAYGYVLDYINKGEEAALAAVGAVPDEPVSTYAFVADPNTGTTLAQGTDPTLTYMLDWDAIASVPHVEDVLDKMRTGSGSWIGYSVINPVTGEVENKRTWLMMHDGLVFGSGYYSSD